MKLSKAFSTIAFLIMAPVATLSTIHRSFTNRTPMTSRSCPYQVQSALKTIDGVSKAEASLETGEAVVVFDDAKTDTESLALMIKSVGFSATVKPGADEKVLAP